MTANDASTTIKLNGINFVDMTMATIGKNFEMLQNLEYIFFHLDNILLLPEVILAVAQSECSLPLVHYFISKAHLEAVRDESHPYHEISMHAEIAFWRVYDMYCMRQKMNDFEDMCE